MVTDEQAIALLAEVKALRYVASTLCGIAHGSGIADIEKQVAHFRRANLPGPVQAALNQFADEIGEGIAQDEAADEGTVRGPFRVIEGGGNDAE